MLEYDILMAVMCLFSLLLCHQPRLPYRRCPLSLVWLLLELQVGFTLSLRRRHRVKTEMPVLGKLLRHLCSSRLFLCNIYLLPSDQLTMLHPLMYLFWCRLQQRHRSRLLWPRVVIVHETC